MKTYFKLNERKCGNFDITVKSGGKIVFKTTRIFRTKERAEEMMEELSKNIMDDYFIFIDSDSDEQNEYWYFIVYDKNDVIFGMSNYFKSEKDVRNALKIIRE